MINITLMYYLYYIDKLHITLLFITYNSMSKPNIFRIGPLDKTQEVLLIKFVLQGGIHYYRYLFYSHKQICTD